jgi:Polyferredoxin
VLALDKRRIVQFLTAFIYNGNLPGFVNGRIWQGNSKQLCVPGLNCYSCPGALGACPIGSLQSFVSGVGLRFPFYVLGLLILFGLLLGRLVCGWFCPFGLIQELLYKIPTPKIHKNTLTLKLTYLKYPIGILFIIIIPLAFFAWEGVGIPAFCKFICPAGTLEAAIPLITLNADLRSSLGLLFGWKFLLMLFTILISIFIYRPFCRFICPLGAWYGIYNKLSLFGIQVDKVKCNGCNHCIKVCKMDCQEVADRECINCGECLKVCPTKAISFKKL